MDHPPSTTYLKSTCRVQGEGKDVTIGEHAQRSRTPLCFLPVCTTNPGFRLCPSAHHHQAIKELISTAFPSKRVCPDRRMRSGIREIWPKKAGYEGRMPWSRDDDPITTLDGIPGAQVDRSFDKRRLPNRRIVETRRPSVSLGSVKGRKG